MIEVKNIIKSFDGTEILHDISAKFYNGKINQIIGPSGSGKTVFMKSIIGLYRVDSGTICYDGRNIASMNLKEIKLLRREVGSLFQGSALFDYLSVLENVMFPMRMFSNLTVQEMETQAKLCLQRVNMPERSYYLAPDEISGGMQKRVAIARAIALNPKYLFCDEPNSGLDPSTSLVIDALIKEITEEKDITTIVNTHDMNSILETNGHINMIYKGNLVWSGTNEEIYQTDNEEVNNLVFASDLFKRIKSIHS
ncbi:ATP-binding cassette domain-containing protein [Gammaproteobacteria bacterium]|nr:ATP-binding cassette domain-containing protein [Gammaproteobacteria bacterium]